MYSYIIWPGVYSFKDEVSMFLLYIKEQFGDLVKKIKRAEKTIDEQ